eukprot:Phypoly_transcript_13604.p1 GENE.Phypoly_transcript_13604~~Phypoly_transcript_13604.p1  ORF type:complete len:336 (+),score=80.11 Phypoly_transcript_13604:43-1008(+)
MAANDDDLDGLLDSTLDDLEKIDKSHTNQTNTKPTTSSLPKPTPTTTTTSTSTSTTATDTDKQDEQLADQFAKQMSELLKNFQAGDLEKNIEEIVKNIGLKLPEGESSQGGEGSSASTADDAADLSKILSAFATLDGSAQGGEGQASGSAESVASKISDRLKEIAENAKNKEEEEGGGEDLEKMLQDFETNPEFQSVMEGMVNQMISKDVLYEPMKELREKYPKWLADNHSKLSEEEYGKYIKQYDIVQKICCVYEASGETTTPEQMQEVVQLMQDMAEYGQPPPDIIKELAPGVQIGPDGVPVFPGTEGGDAGTAGCNIM